MTFHKVVCCLSRYRCQIVIRWRYVSPPTCHKHRRSWVRFHTEALFSYNLCRQLFSILKNNKFSFILRRFSWIVATDNAINRASATDWFFHICMASRTSMWADLTKLVAAPFSIYILVSQG